MYRRSFIAFSSSIACMAVALHAGAQSATPLDRLDPAPAGDPLFAVPSAGVPGRLSPYGELALSYAHAPLVISGDSGQGRSTVATVVGEQLTLHTLLAIDIAQRLKLDVDVPVTIAQSGSALFLGNRTIPAPQGGVLNDVRLGARGEIIRQADAVPSVALGLTAFLPSGGDAHYTGAGVARFGASLILGATYSSAVYSLTLGTHQQKAVSGDLLGSDLYGGFGVALRAGPMQIGPELYGSTVSNSNESAFSKPTTSIEGLLGLRYRIGDFVLGGAGGPGLAAGAGTPKYRLLATFSYAPEQGTAPEPEPPPSKPETAPTPPPTTPPPPPPTPSPPPTTPPPPPPAAGTEKPAEVEPPKLPDQDGDGIPDADDRCPTVAGVTQSDPAKNGCPLATKQAVVKTGGIDARGCPEPLTTTDVQGVQAQLMDPIQFDYRKDELRAEAWPILRHVLQVMQSHPEVQRFAIDGHTDDTGSESVNLGLSHLRAQTVYTWLVDHGVNARRLEIRNFALFCPAVENTSDSGREKNRRVEFRILK